MGQHPNKGPFTDWKDYSATKGDEQAFLDLMNRAKAERDKSEDEKIKANINLYIVCCHLSKALNRDKNYGAALKLSEETLLNKKLLEDASAIWESRFYESASNAYNNNGRPDKAIELLQNSAAVRLRFFSSSLAAPDNWYDAGKIALNDLRDPDLAVDLLRRSVNYCYRWADKYHDEDAWRKNMVQYLTLLTKALEAAGREGEVEKLTAEKERPTFPRPGDHQLSGPYRSGVVLRELL